jgi:hypothetical protein
MFLRPMSPFFVDDLPEGALLDFPKLYSFLLHELCKLPELVAMLDLEYE